MYVSLCCLLFFTHVLDIYVHKFSSSCLVFKAWWQTFRIALHFLDYQKCCRKHCVCLSLRYMCRNLSGVCLETETELLNITSFLTRMVLPISLPAGVGINFYCSISPSTQVLSPSGKRKSKMSVFSVICAKDWVSVFNESSTACWLLGRKVCSRSLHPDLPEVSSHLCEELVSVFETLFSSYRSWTQYAVYNFLVALPHPFLVGEIVPEQPLFFPPQMHEHESFPCFLFFFF